MSFDLNPDYRTWLGALKSRFRQVQLKAAVSVNTALLEFYWDLGADIVRRQAEHAWGSGFLAQLSADLMREFSEVKGFSERNLKYIRQWYGYWQEAAIGKQAVAQLVAIPWGHNLAIIAKCKQHNEAMYYAKNTLTHGWSQTFWCIRSKADCGNAKVKRLPTLRKLCPRCSTASLASVIPARRAARSDPAESLRAE